MLHAILVQEEMISRLSAGAASGRAATAEKALEKLTQDGVRVKKPFVPKRRTFQFPAVERMGQVAVKVEDLTHGYVVGLKEEYVKWWRSAAPVSAEWGLTMKMFIAGMHADTGRPRVCRYQDRQLFDSTSLEIERGERVALIGAMCIDTWCPDH